MRAFVLREYGVGGTNYGILISDEDIIAHELAKDLYLIQSRQGEKLEVHQAVKELLKLHPEIKLVEYCSLYI